MKERDRDGEGREGVRREESAREVGRAGGRKRREGRKRAGVTGRSTETQRQRQGVRASAHKSRSRQVYSAVYRVPVLFLRGRRSSGALLTPEEIWADIDRRVLVCFDKC